MDELQLKNEITKLGADIDTKIEKANGQAKDSLTIATELKAELKAQTEKFAELNKQLDTIEANQKRASFDGQAVQKESLTAMLSGSAEYKSFLADGGRGRVGMDVKATLLKPAVGAGSVIQADVRPGLILPAESRATMRDVVSNATTTSDTIKNLYEDYYTSNSAFVAEGAIKPEDAFALKSEDVPVRTLATLIRLSNQMLADMPFISNYITTRGYAKQEAKLNAQMLYGSGANEDLIGITTKARAFAKTAGLSTVANATPYDILLAAALQVSIAEYKASAVVLNPVQIANMMFLKNTQGNYLFPELQAGVRTIAGMTVVENPAMTVDEFLVGDFKQGATLYQREAARIEFFDQDRDNVQRNLTTIRIEQRMALVTSVPAVFSYGTFTAAKAALAV